MMKIVNTLSGRLTQDRFSNKVYIILSENSTLTFVDSKMKVFYKLIYEKAIGEVYLLNNRLIINDNDSFIVFFFDEEGIYSTNKLKNKILIGFIQKTLFLSYCLEDRHNKYLSVTEITLFDTKGKFNYDLRKIFIKSTANHIYIGEDRRPIIYCLDVNNLQQKWELNFDTKVSQSNKIRFLAEKGNFSLFQVKYNWIVALNNESGQIEWEVSNWYNLDNMEFLGIGKDIYHYNLEENKLHVFQESGYFCLDFESKKFKQYYDIRRDEPNQYLSILTSTYSEGKFYFTAERRNPNEAKYIYEGCNIVGIFDVATLRILEIQELELAHQETLHTAPVVDDKYVYIQGSEGNVYILDK